MKDLVFAIEKSQDEDGRFAQAASKLGYEILAEDDYCPVSRPTFYYGTIERMKSLQLTYMPIVDWCDWDKLACTTYYAKWGEFLLTQEFGFYPLAVVRRQRDSLWRRYQDKDGYVYFRPNANDKVFGGGIFRKELLNYWLLEAEKGRLTDELLCLVGRPSEVHEEYRLVVAAGEVITGSLYLKNDRIHYEPTYAFGAKMVAEEAAKVWSPHPVFVLDVACKSEGEYRIIECGSIHTSGLYECDREKVVEAISKNISSY